jgi:hypothetical protein
MFPAVKVAERFLKLNLSCEEASFLWGKGVKKGDGGFHRCWGFTKARSLVKKMLIAGAAWFTFFRL